MGLAAALAVPLGSRGSDPAPVADYGWMSLEQLGQIKVITASKHLQPAWTIPAAISLITGEEIHLSGATSIPQALRLAPGVDVARINAQRYAVSIRGFTSEYAHKLLVMQDGRSLVTPQFLGVFWDAQDLSLEDVERIEVVRGPGGTAWGINAMNGVVNILTKDARDTQGSLLNVGGGTFERAFATARFGGRLGAGSHYRIYAKSFSRGESEFANGTSAGDDWSQRRTGFRVDSHWGAPNHLTVQGDYYTGQLLQYSNRVADQFRSSGGNLLARLSAQIADGSTLQVMSCLDVVRRQSAPATANSESVVLEANHRLVGPGIHTLSWGANYQHIRNEALGRVGHNYDPAIRRLKLASLSLADDMAVVRDRVVMTVGAKAEYNAFTAWEALPTARLTWTPSERKTGWLAVSRGLQTPDLSSYDLTIDIPGAVNVRSLPNRDRPAGKVLATEIGWRVDPSPGLTVDATVFHHRYDRLPSSASSFDARTSTLTTSPQNEMFGETHGLEVAAIWEPVPRWRLRAGYSLLRMHLHVPAGSGDAASPRREGLSVPRGQWQVMSAATLGRAWDLSTWLRHTEGRPALAIRAYLGWDVRLAYRLSSDVQVAITGKDLLDSRHPEFTRSPGFPTNTEVPRSVQLELTWTR